MQISFLNGFFISAALLLCLRILKGIITIIIIPSSDSPDAKNKLGIILQDIYEFSEFGPLGSCSKRLVGSMILKNNKP